MHTDRTERKNQQVRKTSPRKSPLIFYSLTLLLWPSTILLYVILLVYRKIVDVILHLKIGKNYGGLFDSADVQFLVNDGRSLIMTTVIILKTDREKDLLSLTKSKIQERVFDCPQNYPKLTNTIHTFMGYPYWLWNDLKVDDCVKSLPLPNFKDCKFNEEYLKHLAGKLCNSPLPKNETASWEIFVSRKHLDDVAEDNQYYYPMIIKFHHSVCDGFSFIAWILHTLGKDFIVNYSENIFNRSSNTNLPKGAASQKTLEYFSEMIRSVQIFLYVIFVSLGRIFKISFLRANDKNALHGPKLSGEKIVAWTNENTGFVPIVKGIKNRVPNTKFSDVVYTAVSASLTSYFKRNSQEVPEFTSSLIPITYQYPHAIPKAYVELKNAALAGILELPTVKSSLVETLEEVKIKSEEMRRRRDMVHLNLFVTYIMGVYPVPILKRLSSCNSYTNIISNIPGGGQTTMLDCILEKPIPFAPNWSTTGVTISILTYDDKFILGIILDKTLVSSQEEAQRMLDDIFYYLKMLDEETRKLYS